MRVVRAGFTESGVSNSNRVVERHRSPYGAYWKSHDFPDNVGEHNIFQHPLDFQRAGGEIIFNLPNGLQAYLLVNERGERINQAPTNIVFNKGGSRAEIRNGLSCMSCHANGMRSLTDDVRATHFPVCRSISGSDAAALYPEKSFWRSSWRKTRRGLKRPPQDRGPAGRGTHRGAFRALRDVCWMRVRGCARTRPDQG